MEPISSTRSVRDGFGGNLTLNFQFMTKLRSVFDGTISIVARYMAKQCARNWNELAQGSSPYPKFGGGLATAATAEKISVDGGGDQWREAASNKEDDPETQGGRAG